LMAQKISTTCLVKLFIKLFVENCLTQQKVDIKLKRRI
jgi:hypothetical protein